MPNVALSAYRKLPLPLRDRLRWIRFPWHYGAVELLWRVSGGRVVSGSFRGMRWRKQNLHLAYLLGTQELEIQDAIETLIAQRFPDLINVGASDGYYAVGMALRCPDMRVLAYEADEEHRQELLDVVKLNGVSGATTIEGYCSARELQDALTTRPNSLVLIDIEGGEIDVLDPDAAPLLAGATILVETHDALRPGCAETIRRRFQDSHDIQSIGNRDRQFADLPKSLPAWFVRLAPKTLLAFADEHRNIQQEWLILTPKTPAETAPVAPSAALT